ncbi:MAG: glycoside hydrolase family 127 protein [Butyrivibrio sp.]|nr:beta-L-arabinofuranosidase domain-containing protein [Butyrivibrio sp.]MBQ8032148.1 glycoside hydrolase family 127 protein [Butyrivibrio sp.]MBR1641227.1 glycoside hydrolase family 127 protein [Butyrivibrio sp.]
MLTDTRFSSNAKVKPLGACDTELTEGFWKSVRDVVFDATVPQLENMFKAPEISHVVENFRICAGDSQGDFDGTVFGDGDFYKWMESAIYCALLRKDTELSARIDEYIDLIGRAQRPDGYISTKQIIGEMKKDGTSRMGDINDFEVYNFGHLMTAAALHYRLTGKDSLLKIASKAADYLENMYREALEKDQVQTAVCPSHYMGLIELYRATRDERYLKLARTAIELRDSVKNGLDDNQDRLPLKKHRKIIGHAVRANYLYAGLSDLYLEEGGDDYRAVLDSVWDDLLRHKIYITGGCGALYNGASPYGNFFKQQLVHQAYGYDYQLPNVTAYNETCANVGLVMWAYRMFLIEPKAEYFDVIERVMLNTNLASISLDGIKYFYENMLERVKNPGFDPVWPLHRTEYITSYCCPPNLARNLAQVSEYMYAVSKKAVYLGLYASSRAHIRLDSGFEGVIETKTDYPYGGTVSFAFTDIETNGEIELNLRIPAWAKKGYVKVTGPDGEIKKTLDESESASYYCLKIQDPSSTKAELFLDMPVRYTVGHDRIEEVRGRVCVERGPLVFCMEEQDAGKTALEKVMLPYEKASFTTEIISIKDREILTIRGNVFSKEGDDNEKDKLYRELKDVRFEKTDARFIPYFAWDNRGDDKDMRVYFPVCYGGVL